MSIIELLQGFVTDFRVRILIALILMDLILGVAKACAIGTFEWRRIADFYKTMVLSKLLGFLAFYLPAKLVVGVDPKVAGQASVLFSETAITIAWGVLVASLVASIVANAKALGYKVLEQAPDPPDTG